MRWIVKVILNSQVELVRIVKLFRLVNLGHFISVFPLWAYAENFVKIHQDLAEISRFDLIGWLGHDRS